MVDVIVIIYYILFALSFMFGMYFAVTGLFGFKNYHKSMFGRHKPKYKFAIIVPSRNEEKVIGGLIKSLQKQRYPDKLYEVYVVPNNCTDDTAGAAKKAGANVIECTVPVKVKADVLQFVFKKFKSRDDIDAYVIFDADNLVHPNFLARMNDALCEGVQVAQCFRDAKNMGDNWLTGSYTLFYFIQNFFFNRARMNFSGSAAINGTGFMIKKEVVANGFNTKTLTEDSEFTGQCALRGIQVAFVEEAITYDEHPQNFWASWKQRKRWTSGCISCLQIYGKDLLKTFFKTGNISCFDMVMMYLCPIVMVLGFFLSIVLIVFHITGVELFDFFSYLYAMGILFFVLSYLATVAMNIFVVKYNKKSIKNVFSGIILFALFLATWIPINIICIFKKTEKWEEIKHDRSDVDLDELIN
ncbi:TPA: glycosyltransferase family 2 protein [Candidatus Ventrenecus stercoripullorum]|nr:glycosyltransferase family 2 protein [Candidatus Ventrenecus stercoripullorum]